MKVRESIVTDVLPSHVHLAYGYSLELVKQSLDNFEITYCVDWNFRPQSSPNHFRHSVVIASVDDLTKLTSILGESQMEWKRSLYYFGRYDVLDSFDYSMFDGKITFDKGRLVELINVRKM